MTFRNALATTFSTAAAVCAIAASPASAAVTFTSSAAFAAATSAPGVDTYAGFSISGVTTSPISRSAGTYGYTASAANGFFGAGTTANPWLSTNTATDSVIFTGFGANVRGIGGLFFGSNSAGAYTLGNIVLTLIDAAGTTTYTINGATTNSFVGFVSTGAITSLTVTAVQPSATFLWPTIDNLTLAQAPTAAAVPEPATWGMMILGFGMIGAAARSRKTKTTVSFA